MIFILVHKAKGHKAKGQNSIQPLCKHLGLSEHTEAAQYQYHSLNALELHCGNMADRK